MSSVDKRLVALIAATLLLSPATYGARPLITDDARLVDAKGCQLESWVRSNQGSREYWALPACNITGNLEFTLGGGRTTDAEGSRTTDLVFQGKALFKPMAADGWGFGLAAGAIRHPGEGRRIGDLYAYVPASFSVNGDKAFVHANVGVSRNIATASTRATAGVGTEVQLSERAWLIAETYKQNEGRPFFQAGARYWILPNRVQLDATIGNRFGSRGDERWFSLGLRLLTPAFLP